MDVAIGNTGFYACMHVYTAPIVVFWLISVPERSVKRDQTPRTLIKDQIFMKFLHINFKTDNLILHPEGGSKVSDKILTFK